MGNTVARPQGAKNIQWLEQHTDGSVRFHQALDGTLASASSTELTSTSQLGWTPVQPTTKRVCPAAAAQQPPPPPPPETNCSLTTVHCVGGPNSEFATIQAAVNAMAGGHTVVVFDGNYAGFNIPSSKSGTNATRSVIRVNTGSVVNIVSANARGEGITFANASYVTVDGFKMNGIGPEHGIATHDASPTNPMRGLTIRNNTVTNSQVSNIYASNVADSLIEGNTLSGAVEEHGIYLANGGSDNTIVRNNKASNNARNGIHLNGDSSIGGDGLHQNITIEGNTFFNNTSNGMDIDGLHGGVIRNNLLYGNGTNAVRVFRIDAAAGAGNLQIYNNTLVTNGGAPIKLTADVGGHVIFNNILLNANTGNFALVTGNATFSSDRNIVSGRFSRNEEGTAQTLAQWQALGYDTSSFASTAAALFVNAAAGDYRLKAGSPAANAGIGALAGVSAPTTDITGASRPIGVVDIGAYESF
jgi:parallel beta-helix repeat protein